MHKHWNCIWLYSLRKSTHSHLLFPFAGSQLKPELQWCLNSKEIRDRTRPQIITSSILRSASMHDRATDGEHWRPAHSRESFPHKVPTLQQCEHKPQSLMALVRRSTLCKTKNHGRVSAAWSREVNKMKSFFSFLEGTAPHTILGCHKIFFLI